MKKLLTLAAMMVMLFSVSLTANAKVSPSAEKVEDKPSIVQTVSPKTGENELIFYGLGAAAIVLASGAVIIRKYEMSV